MEGFICSVKFFSIPDVMRVACQHDGSDRSASLRMILFIKLLCMCADGMKVEESNFPRLLGCCGRQVVSARELWMFCVNADILRYDGGGYSTLGWMRQNNLLVSSDVDTKSDAPKQQSKTQSERPRSENTLHVRPIKRQIIPGGMVWMTDDEIRELKTELSDEDFRGACDILDEYLRANPTRNYSSALIPMRRWCIKKWLETKAKRNKTTIDTSMGTEDMESLKELFRT